MRLSELFSVSKFLSAVLAESENPTEVSLRLEEESGMNVLFLGTFYLTLSASAHINFDSTPAKPMHSSKLKLAGFVFLPKSFPVRGLE
jgi:hypothetical protein